MLTASFVSLVFVISGCGNHEDQTIYSEQSEKLVNQVDVALTENAPTTWVYDREDNRLFAIKTSERLQSVSSVPTEISKIILHNANGSPSQVIAMDYFSDNGIVSPTEKQFDVFVQALEDNFSQDQLICYLAQTSDFGEYKGLVEACSMYFGKELKNISEEEIKFLSDAYRNKTIDISSYSDSFIDLDFTSAGSSYDIIRELITEQLSAIEGIDLSTKSYQVKLTISKQQQITAQTAIDEAMKEFIEISSDKTYTQDLSCLLVDRNTGSVRVYIPSRTSKYAVNQFSMLSSGFSENIEALKEELKDSNVFGTSLQVLETSNGKEEIRSLSSLFYTLDLAAYEDSPLSVLDIPDILFAGSSNFKGLNFISEVKSEDGKTVYSNPQNSILGFDSDNLYDFFASDNNGYTSISSCIKMDYGCIVFEETQNYFQCAIAGSDTLGSVISSVDMQTFEGIISDLFVGQSKAYPATTDKLWAGNALLNNKSVMYADNEAILRPKLDEDLGNLEIPIDSVESRVTFETMYEDFITSLNSYIDYVTEDFISYYTEFAYKIRQNKSYLLMKYSV